jgi:cobalamin biosynthesis protein CobW
VQGVGARFSHHFERAWATGETRGSRLVVIGEKGLDQGAIRRILAA